MKFTDSLRILRNKNHVILANIVNGFWIKISDEVFEIIKAIMKENIEDSQLEQCFEIKEDYIYIKDIIEELKSWKIIINKDDKVFYNNETISIELTHRCNLHCIHCCIDAVNNSDDSMDLTTDEIKIILDKCIEWNPRSVMLSGGEPMLRMDFFEILGYLRSRYNGTIIVSTNGTLINENNVNKLCGLCDQLEISVDGVDEESCSIVRGRGIFQKVINNVKLIKDTGFEKVNLSMVIYDKNAGLEAEFIELNKKLGTNPVCRMFSPVGRGEKSLKIFSDMDEDKIYIPKSFMEENKDKKDKICTCSAGKRELFISAGGDIYPCPSYINEKCRMGNIFEIDRLSAITSEINTDLNVSREVNELDPKNNEPCSSCNVNLFCWTCPGATESIKNKNMFNNQCGIIKKVLTKRIWGEEI